MTKSNSINVVFDDIYKDMAGCDAEMFGAFHSLMYYFYENEKLPEDEHLMAHIARVSHERWLFIKPTFLAIFNNSQTVRKQKFSKKKRKDASKVAHDARYKSCESQNIDEKSNVCLSASPMQIEIREDRDTIVEKDYFIDEKAFDLVPTNMRIAEKTHDKKEYVIDDKEFEEKLSRIPMRDIESKINKNTAFYVEIRECLKGIMRDHGVIYASITHPSEECAFIELWLKKNSAEDLKNKFNEACRKSKGKTITTLKYFNMHM